ncbi:hypothetical protein HDG34_005629 [Paraburkholderia sp. HC6.4b]|uniref:hypothetical protein n=1 Tax=unclassified Paraburkholderia TaxID=2615204 RepID=UPI00161396E3|nr:MULTISPECIES: hypothetical protein [unclassified Paraburkholderia]MBB5411668.1 hypothetical protein [Paraburkholderia sp. HC6.4b]MBB5453303.1 hypothetical protein [Paraburkholderia sp. Kb1A]
MTDSGIKGSFAIRIARRARALDDYERAARVVLRDAEAVTRCIGGRLAELREQDARARALLADSSGLPACAFLLALADALQDRQP